MVPKSGFAHSGAFSFDVTFLSKLSYVAVVRFQLEAHHFILFSFPVIVVASTITKTSQPTAKWMSLTSSIIIIVRLNIVAKLHLLFCQRSVTLTGVFQLRFYRGE